MTKSAAPLPKLRVTNLPCGDAALQCSHGRADKIDSDDNEPAAKAGFDDDFRRCAVERDARDDALDFAGLGIALALPDLPGEDDVFEIED